jgi:4-hydroxy-2-oxoheptanedioate aldolase
MRPSKIKAKLTRNEPALVVTLHFTDPSVYELTSLMGFDGIWMDLEHHGTSVETAMTLLRAARVGSSDVMVRPAKGEFMRLGRLLETGAQGILYPRCDDAVEARQVITWSKFAPLGKRGFDGGNADMPYCTMPVADYIHAANEQTFVIIQIEEASALTHARAIAEVEGVDALFLGPADFSILGGFPGQFDHPNLRDATRQIAEAARQAGKHWGTTTGSLEQAKRLLDLGARFLCFGADILWLKQGLEQMQRQFSGLGFTFTNQLSVVSGQLSESKPLSDH